MSITLPAEEPQRSCEHGQVADLAGTAALLERFSKLTHPFYRIILKHILNQPAALDLLFHALADPTRRAMVERLSRGPASVGEVAKPLAMSLPAVLQHLQVLEASGLVRSQKTGRVFAAWADSKIKADWFGAPDQGGNAATEFDFRVGGRESSSGAAPSGQSYRYDACYQDIVPDQRIVYSYDMHLDDVRISVSLATIELQPQGAGTRLTVTEQGAYLDGLDTPAQREAGTSSLMDQLGQALERR